MPQFIKMGLGGTGFLGHQESHQRAARKRAQRRKVIEGFPITRQFESHDEVQEYFSHEKIVCLLCGRVLRSLGTHLRSIHAIEADEYRERYRIPWTYGLVGSLAAVNYSKAVVKRMEDGWDPSNPDIGKKVHEKRPSPFKEEVAKNNLGDRLKPTHPLMPGPDGKLHTYTELRDMAKSKRGTPEFTEKMKNRYRTPEHIDILRTWWKGKKQSEEHKAKRFKRFNPPLDSPSVTPQSLGTPPSTQQ